MLRGVFSSHIGAQTVTKEALAAEERGDFKEALDQYKEVLCGVWVIDRLCAQCDCLGRWCAVCACGTFQQLHVRIGE